MRAGIRISSLVPSGLVIESVSDSSDSIIFAIRSKAVMSEYPLCGTASRRIHSRYARQVADLPCAGRQIRLRVIARRFLCEIPYCRRRIFAERFGQDIVPVRSRRTARLECIIHHLGLALGGRPAACFAKRLMLPVSNGTLLRVVRRRDRLRAEPLIIADIDDWAFRRNHRYGTIVCDPERLRIVRLLPNREIATVQAWLSNHPGIRIVSRDRGGGYGEAAAKALPETIQVADRWHLMENASAAFLGAVRRLMRVIRTAIGATTIDPELLTCAKRLQFNGYLRREETNAAIMALVKDDVPLKEIARRTGRNRKLVRQVSRGESTDISRTRQSTLDAHLPFIAAQWATRCRNGAELWRRLQAHSFRGSLRVVSEWTTRRRHAEILLPERPTPEAIARIFADFDPTIFFAVPAVVRSILEYCRKGGTLTATSLKFSAARGENLPPQTFNEWKEMTGTSILETIGSTELLHGYITNQKKRIKLGSTGLAVPGYDIKLVNDEGQEGQHGVLFVKGGSAFRRYWNNDEKTSETIIDGYVRTGDIYRRDDEGYVQVLRHVGFTH